MNLNVPDLSAVSRFFGGLLSDLRQKKLWPVAALLLVALVAVPVLLSKSSHPAPVAQAPVPAPPPSAATSLPALSVESTQPHSNLNGPAHNPFGAAGTNPSTSSGSPTSSVVSTATATASNAASTVSGGAGPNGSTGSSSSSSSSTSTQSTASAPATTGTSTSSNPPSITPNAKPKQAPSGLTKTQAYDVSLAMTNGDGGVGTTDPLERLSLIPSEHQPLLVELGVAQGGKRVLFAVQPGAVVSGPGSCVPGPIDCEILSLGQDETEQLAQRTGTVGPSTVALFAVTGISATSYPSAAAADNARRTASASGRALLDKSTSSALSLFQYDPSLGSVVDLSNLKVEG